MGEALVAEIREMNKPLTKHQMILQFKAWGWTCDEIAAATGVAVSVVRTIVKSPMALDIIESLRISG